MLIQYLICAIHEYSKSIRNQDKIQGLTNTFQFINLQLQKLYENNG